MFNRQQHSKLITNSLVMILLFYIILAIITRALFTLITPLWGEYQLLFLPILLGYIGMSWGIFNLSYDPIVKWKNTRRVTFFIIAGAVTLFLSQIILIIIEWLPPYPVLVETMYYIGVFLLFISGLLIAFGFFKFRQDLLPHYFDKYIAKYPNWFIIIAYISQSFSYVFFVISGLTFGNLGSAFEIIGYIVAGGSILSMAIGFYSIFISFRAFPKIMEVIEEVAGAKKKSKKAS